jgi:hypothetical protein
MLIPSLDAEFCITSKFYENCNDSNLKFRISYGMLVEVEG